MSVNIELFQKIKKHILKDQNRLCMEWWCGIDSCGTSACIAGWAYILSNNNVRCHESMISSKIYEIAKLLGIDNHYRNVFWVIGWKAGFYSKWYNACSRKEKTQVAADYIDFICEGGLENATQSSSF